MLDKKRAEELRKKIEKLREEVLDDEQIDAVDAILDDWKQENGFIFPIVDGPPGTGKTTVGSVATLQYLLENPRRQVLYMCYTNQACAMAQRAMIKVLEDSEPILRLEYGRRTSWKERAVVGYGRESIRSDEEVRKLDSVPALISTLYSSSMAIWHRRRCKVIFDEFSQINPALFFDVIYRIRSKMPDGFALLGDPLQLPVVTSQPRLETNIGTYILSLKNITSIPLKVQHRMHEDICSAINSMRNALGGKQPLVSAPNVRHRDMTTWYEWKKSAAGAKYRDILDPSHPLVIVNTDSLSGGVPGAEEVVSRRRVSCRNVPEASLAADLFAAASVTYERTAPETAGFQILTPYGAQTREIREQLGRRLGSSFKKSICDTIHSSQGNEYDLVIVSFVRSNIGGRLGFMEDERLASLAYVACSRAKAKLIVLLSEGTFLVGRHKVFDALCSTKEAHRVEAPT